MCGSFFYVFDESDLLQQIFASRQDTGRVYSAAIILLFFQDRGTGENETGKKPWDGNKSGQFRRIPMRFGSCSGETTERKKGYPAGNGTDPEPLSDGMSCIVPDSLQK